MGLERARDFYQKDFVTYLSVERNLSPRTVEEYAQDLNDFFHSKTIDIEKNQDFTLDNVDERTIREYLAELKQRKTRSQKGYTPRAVNRKIAALKSYFDFLEHDDHVKRSPAEKLKSVKDHRPLPKVLSVNEMSELLTGVPQIEVPKDITPIWLKKHLGSLRDRAILELLYASGIRVSELTGLDLGDLSLQEKTAKVLGKGQKERIILMNDAAAAAIENYLKARPDVPHDALFLNRHFQRISVRMVQLLLKKHLKRAGIRKPASPHTLRHSFATHLLEGGADLVTIKELLGHANLSTTQIYTNISLSHIKKTYQESHPRSGNNNSTNADSH